MESFSVRLSKVSSKKPELSTAFPVLPRSFYTRHALEVAPDLLGKGLWSAIGGQVCLGEIVEVEAYLGSSGNDPASHTYRGRNERNKSMFLDGGVCYVYLSYGLHYCMNVVTGHSGVGEGILLRAAAPILGETVFRKRRHMPKHGSMKNALNGPGKLTQAFGIDLRQDATPFDSSSLKIVDLGHSYRADQIVRTKRVGLTKAAELPLRFIVKDSRWLSRSHHHDR